MKKISSEDFLKVYNDIESYPTIQDVADEVGCHWRTVYRKADKFLEDGENVRKTKGSFDRSETDEEILHRNLEDKGVTIDDVAYYWLKTNEVSALIKRKGVTSYFDIRDRVIKEMKKYAPKYAKIKHKPGDHLMILDAADVHIGKLCSLTETGYTYNCEEAVRRVREGVSYLMNNAKLMGVDKICLVIGNDIIHVDGQNNTTTGGTRQDTDKMWHEMWQIAKECYIALIEELTQVADVHIVHCPSNHDNSAGYYLADTLYSWFHKNKNVSFGKDQASISQAHRKYMQYGANLIGFTHMDGAKEADLPHLLQFEAREYWAQSKFSYIYGHHTHHKSRSIHGMDRNTAGKQLLEKDRIGFTIMRPSIPVDPSKNVYVEVVRSPSPEDAWHNKYGFTNMQAIECFLHHYERGQVARFTHFF